MGYDIIVSTIVSIFAFIYTTNKKKGKLLWRIIFSIGLIPFSILLFKGAQSTFLEGKINAGYLAMKRIVEDYTGIYLFVLVFMICAVDVLFINKNKPKTDNTISTVNIKRTMITKSIVNGQEVSSQIIVDEKVIDPTLTINKCYKCGVEIEKGKTCCEKCFAEEQNKKSNTNMMIITAVYLIIYGGFFLLFSTMMWLFNGYTWDAEPIKYTLWDYLTKNIPFAFFFACVPCIAAIILSYKSKKYNYLIFNLIFFIVNL